MTTKPTKGQSTPVSGRMISTAGPWILWTVNAVSLVLPAESSARTAKRLNPGRSRDSRLNEPVLPTGTSRPLTVRITPGSVSPTRNTVAPEVR